MRSGSTDVIIVILIIVIIAIFGINTITIIHSTSSSGTIILFFGLTKTPLLSLNVFI